MAKEDKVINIIKGRIEEAENGTLFFNNSFPDFDDEYVGQILSDLAKDGVIHHLSRGVYLKTEQTRFGPVYPSPTEIAEAIARRDHAQVLMSGLAAENYFGLSTQVPMKVVFLTSGSARKLTVGNTEIEFKRGVPRNFAFKDRMMATLCLALKSIGNGHVTEEQRAVLKRFLIEYMREHAIKEDIKLMPQWIQRLLNEIIKEVE